MAPIATQRGRKAIKGEDYSQRGKNAAFGLINNTKNLSALLGDDSRDCIVLGNDALC